MSAKEEKLPIEEKAGPKKRIVRWRGVLADDERGQRLMIAVALCVAAIAFTFTQLGFIGIELPDGTSAYIVTLLQLVALGSLLLGTVFGMLFGVFAGVVLYLHASFLPLDHFEFTFVTPVTSIAMLGISGFVLGVLFAFVLRNNPSQVKRIIYIVIVSFFVSMLFSNVFMVTVVISFALQIFETMSADVSTGVVNNLAGELAARLGNVGMMVIASAVLMALLCCIGDYLARRALEHKGVTGMRTVFGAWLSVVVALAFLVMAAASFTVTTINDADSADQAMRSEVNYLSGQFEDFDERSEVMSNLLEKAQIDLEELSEDEFNEIVSAFSDARLINGYTIEDDGSVIVMFSNLIYASNDERFLKSNASTAAGAVTKSVVADEVMSEDMRSAIETSLEQDALVQFIFDDMVTSAIDSTGQIEYEALANANPTIAYIYAKRVNVSEYNGETIGTTIVSMWTSDKVHAGRSSIMLWTTLASLVLLAVVFAIVFLLLNRVVGRRIDEANGVLARVTAGDLDARVPEQDTLEFESLSEGINTTVETLKGWIAEAETRMDAELATAKSIQEAALPRTFPPFPDILRFDIYATMQAAKEVGGDFYDFFLIGDCNADDGKLGFVLADVSGKGVPAALFMMKAKTQIRDYMESGMELGEAIENANRQLCDGNDADMFVTVFAGVLDYATKHVEFVNAGHNPPLLWQKESGWRWLKEKSGLPLGLFDGMPYKAHSFDCEIGDQLLLYTDGVTEAMNVEDSLYGEERLEDLARANYRLHPRKLVHAVRGDVAKFAQGAEQSDDITILALEIGVPPENTATLIVPARTEELPRVNEFIHTELDRRLCPLRAQGQLDIAVEELFVNVAHYAYPDATPDDPGTVRISYTYSAEPPSITVDIIDEGIPYNPLAKPDAVTPDDIMEVPVGGLGILMAKRSVDEMRYERVDETNVVTIVKKW